MSPRRQKKISIKFLGTSSGEAIPRLGCDCAQCASADLKDKRLRSSLLINKKVLIDVGPDILKQLRKNQIENIELALITHDHLDHSGGLNDLKKVNPKINVIRLQPGQHFAHEEIEYYAFKVKHSPVITTVGVEIGPAIYIPDVADLDWAQKYLQESKLAILDGSVLNRSFSGHMALNQIIIATKNMKNLRKVYFSHNGHTRLSHKEMTKIVKTLGNEKFFIAYDGLEITV